MTAVAAFVNREWDGDAVIVIDPEFEALLPPLSEEEREELATSIRVDGVRDPLVVWKRGTEYVLLDGHNRYRIAEDMPDRVGLDIVDMEFPSRAEAMAWMITNQFARRNLPDFVRVKLALRLKGILTQAKNEGQQIDGRLNAKIGEMADISHEGVRKVEVVLSRAPQSVVQAAERGEISTNRAYVVTRALDDAPKEVRDMVEKYCLEEPDTIKLLIRLKNENRESFWDLYNSGFLQPGDEDEAVPVTAGFAALSEALRKAAQQHIKQSVAAKTQDAVDQHGQAGVKIIEFSTRSTFDLVADTLDKGELVNVVSLAATQSVAALSILTTRNFNYKLMGIMAHNAVMFIRVPPGQSIEPVAQAERFGLTYAGPVLLRNPARSEWGIVHVLSKSPVSLTGRDQFVIDEQAWEWHYEAWAQLSRAFSQGGTGVDLATAPPAFAAIGLAHALDRVLVAVDSDVESQIRAAAQTFSRLRG